MFLLQKSTEDSSQLWAPIHLKSTTGTADDTYSNTAVSIRSFKLVTGS